jgi:hypothetical protein
MKLEITIPDEHAGAVIDALQSIITQLMVKPEPLTLRVNGLYWTADRKMAHCIDIRRGLFVCEIDGFDYLFFSNGEPALHPGAKEYHAEIVEKIDR